MSKEIKYYDYTNSQYAVAQAEQLCGKIYNNITIMINFDEDGIDADKMESAINQAIELYPSAKLRIHEFKKSELEKEGCEINTSWLKVSTTVSKDPIIPRQYFNDNCGVKCERFSFKNDKKMYKFINKVAKEPFPNNYNDCDLFRVCLIQRENGHYGVLLKFYHIIADTYGILKFGESFIDIYMSLTKGTPMPEPMLPLLPALQDCWDYEKSEHIAENQKFWDEFWPKVKVPQGVSINGYANKKVYIPGKRYLNYLNILNVKAKQINYKIPAQLTKKVDEFAISNMISPRNIYLLAINTWLSMQSDGYDAFTYLDLVAFRSKKTFTKTSGSFALAITTYVNVTDDMTFLDACTYLKGIYFKQAKHNRLLGTDINNMLHKQMDIVDSERFKFPWVRGINAFLFTYQPFFKPGDENSLKISLERFTSGRSPLPIYAMFMPTDNYTGEMNLNFEYMTAINQKEDFDKFVEFMLKFLDAALTTPQKTISELKEV